jgi:hypothetical protein
MHPISTGTETPKIFRVEEMILVISSKVEFYVKVLIP